MLAHEATALIHGAEEAEKAQAGAQEAFGGAGWLPREEALALLPTTAISSGRLEAGLPLTDILPEVGLAKSKGEVRRLIQQGGVSVNDSRVGETDFSLTGDHTVDGGILLLVGKKKYHRLVVG